MNGAACWHTKAFYYVHMICAFCVYLKNFALVWRCLHNGDRYKGLFCLTADSSALEFHLVLALCHAFCWIAPCLTLVQYLPTFFRTNCISLSEHTIVRSIPGHCSYISMWDGMQKHLCPLPRNQCPVINPGLSKLIWSSPLWHPSQLLCFFGTL